MPTRFRVLPYRAGSRGATALSRGLNGMCLRLGGQSRFRPRGDDLVINWGNTNDPEMVRMCHFNNVDLREATNKLNFFNQMRGRGLDEIIPRFWTNRNDIPADAYPIVCRTVLAGHSGEGIVIADTPNDLVAAPLYVEYIKKNQEWRIHVGRYTPPARAGFNERLRQNGGYDESIIISRQRKARSRDVPDDQVNWQVRNVANGFIYARNDGVEPPQEVINAARRVLEATVLDFGAVDVIYNEREGRAYVLEINTAPGLAGTTVDDYVNYFRRFVR